VKRKKSGKPVEEKDPPSSAGEVSIGQVVPLIGNCKFIAIKGNEDIGTVYGRVVKVNMSQSMDRDYMTHTGMVHERMPSPGGARMTLELQDIRWLPPADKGKTAMQRVGMRRAATRKSAEQKKEKERKAKKTFMDELKKL
jgi:hypothetical protein